MRTVTWGGEKKAAAYLARFNQLWARYAHVDCSSDWAGFTDWLISLRSGLRPASWRQYRAAVVFAMTEQQVADQDALHARLMAPINLPDRKSLPDRTSSAKSKTLSRADMNALIKYLGSHEGRWNRLTGQWLVFGMLTGLRPIEWQRVKAYPNEDELVLTVLNAKHDGLRAHGVERTIHVKISVDMQQSLVEFIHDLQSDEFAEAYQGCRIALRRATKELWPRRKKNIALYSARHQFSADAKSAGLAPEVIAALMGHAVTDTHQTHYGKRRSGCGRVLVEAEAGDVMRVIARMEQKSVTAPVASARQKAAFSAII